MRARLVTAASMVVLMSALAVAGGAGLTACDSGGGDSPAVSGTVKLHLDEGVDLHSGMLMSPGNFQNSDLFTAANGATLELISGGATPTQSRPVNWFVTGGGVPQTFDSLAEVPDTAPAEGMGTPLLHPKTGNGFVVKRKDGGYSRGWLSSVESSAIVIEFAPIVNDE